MTKKQFIESRYPLVRFKGRKMEIIKQEGETSAPLCAPGEYDNFIISFAFVRAEEDVIVRYGFPIGTLKDLKVIKLKRKDAKL